MELLGTVTNAIVVLVVGGLLSWQLSGRFKAVDARFEAIDARFEAVEARLDSIQRSVDGLRSDLTQVALAVGMQPGPRRGA
jgi:hypothetical protein